MRPAKSSGGATESARENDRELEREGFSGLGFGTIEKDLALFFSEISLSATGEMTGR